MKIRKARPKDAKEISKLRIDTIRKINSIHHSKEQTEVLVKYNSAEEIFKKMKMRKMFCLVDGNYLLGVIDLDKHQIGGFFIKHNEIRKGYGEKLLRFIEEYAKNKGVKKVTLYSTKFAIPFYKEYGYKTTQKTIFVLDNVEFPEIKMEKRL